MTVRIGLLRWLTVLGAATVIITEFLSLFHAIDATALAIAWGVVLPALLLFRPLRFEVVVPRVRLFPSVAVAVIAVIAVIAGLICFTALLSPPNSADTMAYHLPRVLHWMQSRSVAFFPTSYLNLIMLQPAAEYMMLHAYVLSGTDAFSNLFQFIGYFGCIVGVSCLAGLYGLDEKAQAIAALFCATLPNAILQASGAKNDLVLACFLVCGAVFAARWSERRKIADLVLLAVAFGMAFFTKGTAYLFGPPLLMAIVPVRQWLRASAAVVLGILAINGPQYVRNMDLSGSPLGFDSAQADGLFRWRVERFGWKPTVSNLLRNTSEQLAARSEDWNQRVFRAVIRVHEVLGIDPQDSDTTWRWTAFRAPRNANHEADANNKWHLLLFLLSLILCRGRWARYAAGVIGAFLLFCFYLKWQPYFSRVLVPLFVLMSPVAAMAISRIPSATLQVLICALLVTNARLPLMQNWTRPLTGPKSLLRVSRNEAYFNDISLWNNREACLHAVSATAATRCPLVGIDISQNHVQYPYMALLRQQAPGVRFVEVGVENPSVEYAPQPAPQPCAVLCLDCDGNARKLAQYRAEYGAPQVFGRFLLYDARGDPRR